MLNALPWKSEEGMMFGKPYKTRRQIVLLSMTEKGLTYDYGQSQIKAAPYPKLLDPIIQEIISHSPTINSCLVNYYPDGLAKMGYHSDDESELGENPTILSLSLGATRKLKFKHRLTHEVIDVNLTAGSLLTMEGSTQHHWKHSIPEQRKVEKGRISLTFRTIQI